MSDSQDGIKNTINTTEKKLVNLKTTIEIIKLEQREKNWGKNEHSLCENTKGCKTHVVGATEVEQYKKF